jgi:hypothetical protein
MIVLTVGFGLFLNFSYKLMNLLYSIIFNPDDMKIFGYVSILYVGSHMVRNWPQSPFTIYKII